MPKTRWGEAIAVLLAERGWSQKQLADAASVRPNTLTNLIKHGRDSDTATLTRIAAALRVDLGDLFLTRDQMQVLRAHHELEVERVRETVVKELSATVIRLVREKLDQARPPGDPARPHRPPRRRPRAVRPPR